MTEVNPIVTLKAQAERLDFRTLRAKEDNKSANSGEQMYKDINRMDFVINGKSIDKSFINQLCEEYTNLIANNKSREKNYRTFTKEVFEKMFQCVGAKVPSSHILEELVTSCNQAGYEFVYAPFMAELCEKHKLFMNVNGGNVDRKVCIECRDPNSVKVESKLSKAPVIIIGPPTEKICDTSFSLEFTLESEEGKDGVTYRDGNLSLDIPEELKNYQDGDKSLFDIIKGYFQKFCAMLGFIFEPKIEHNLGGPLKVNSHLKSVESPAHNNHGN